jgi:hypothetical protein
MITINIKVNVDKLMEVVRDLRARSMVQGQDFDFAYHPVSSGHSIVSYDPFGDEFDYPESYASFGFYNEKYATMFMLKYGNLIKTKECDENSI